MSKRKNTSEEGWWIVHNTAASFLAISFKRVTQFKAETESKPEVGSSKNNSYEEKEKEKDTIICV